MNVKYVRDYLEFIIIRLIFDSSKVNVTHLASKFRCFSSRVLFTALESRRRILFR